MSSPSNLQRLSYTKKTSIFRDPPSRPGMVPWNVNTLPFDIRFKFSIKRFAFS